MPRGTTTWAHGAYPSHLHYKKTVLTRPPNADISSRTNYPAYAGRTRSSRSPSTGFPKRARRRGRRKRPSSLVSPSSRVLFPSCSRRASEDGSTSTIDLAHKWSTTIAKELMDLAGGEPWRAYKASALAAGHPVLPGEEKERLAQVNTRRKTTATKTSSSEEMEAQVQEMLSAPSRPRTGAAAILP